ncbi:MAG: Lrp/AsnC family transcriptional regulator [Marinilabiliaceae bacterium]
MAQGKLDKTDYHILRILQQNCNLTTKELAQQANLSTTPVFERVRRMEKDGVIRKYVAVLDNAKINYGFTVYCNVKLKQVNYQSAKEFVEAIKPLREVSECYNVSGEYDYILKIYARDMKDYQHFILNVLGKIDSIGGIQSNFVIDTAKDDIGIQLPDLDE